MNSLDKWKQKMIETGNMPTIEDWIDTYLIYDCCAKNLPFAYNVTPFYFKESATEEDYAYAKWRKDAQIIYLKFINWLGLNMDKADRDMLNTYRINGDIANYKYAFKKYKKSSLQDKLNNNKQIIQASKYGKIIYQFISRNKLNAPKTWEMAYDDEADIIYLFVENDDYITKEEILNIIRHPRNFEHELTHLIDNRLKIANHNQYDQSDFKQYVNDPDEFKAICQQLIVAIGTYIKKHWRNIDFDKLNDLNYIGELLYNIFDEKTLYYKKNEDNIEMYKFQIDNMDDEHKKKLFNYIRNYLLDIYDTDKDIDLNENRNRLIKLFRPEEYFMRTENAFI